MSIVVNMWCVPKEHIFVAVNTQWNHMKTLGKHYISCIKMVYMYSSKYVKCTKNTCFYSINT
jgi:hypothetical protein